MTDDQGLDEEGFDEIVGEDADDKGDDEEDGEGDAEEGVVSV